MKWLAVIILLLTMYAAKAQIRNSITIIVTDSVTSHQLGGVSVVNVKTSKGGSTTDNGVYLLNKQPDGNLTLRFSFIGYREKEVTIQFPYANDTLSVLLSAKEQNLNEVVVTSTRSANRIEDLPMKVEVLGSEEMQEESGIKPGNVGGLLGDLSIIHIQNTSAVNGSNAIRMQGLDGKYTQMLRDGVPVYEGISGNFGVLSIPPLDLKQIEIIKGSISTLYGGGAIAGMINFVSKTPTIKPELTVLLNHSTLKENNINVYYSQKWKKTGLTMFAGTTIQNAVDVNGDGFSDLPKLNQYIVHPKFFYYIHQNATLTAGYTGTFENRQGGDMQIVKDKIFNPSLYFDKIKSGRNSFDIQFMQKAFAGGKLTAKGVVSNFNVNENEKYFITHGNQLNTYTEVSYNKKFRNNEFVVGFNNTSEDYKRKNDDSTLVENYFYNTTGLFVQDGFHFSKKVMMEMGFRADHHNKYAWFALPRIALVYKPVTDLSMRLSTGTGYKVPEIFTTQTQMMGYKNLLPLSSDVVAEKSVGVNFDVNYNWQIGDVKMTINQALYYTNINHPIVPVVHADGFYSLQNADAHARSLGTDTYVQGKLDDWELYVGYNHTASVYTDAAKTFMPYAPRDKFAATLAYEIEPKWRMGIESSWTGNQYLPNNTKAPSYWFWAAMVQRNLGEHFVAVLNCENVFDARQGKNEPLYTGTKTNPQFVPLWGPIDGRVVNLSLKFSL